MFLIVTTFVPGRTGIMLVPVPEGIVPAAGPTPGNMVGHADALTATPCCAPAYVTLRVIAPPDVGPVSAVIIEVSALPASVVVAGVVLSSPPQAKTKALATSAGTVI